MDIGKYSSQGVTVVTLTGDLDSRSAPETQRRLVDLVPQDGLLLVDLSGVPYMSSAGLRAMLLVHRRVDAVNGRMALSGMSPELRSVMSATGFLEFFADAPTVDEGIEVLRA